MSISPAFRFLRHALPSSATAALLLCSFGLVSPARAVTLCPNQATVGGFGGTSTNVVGPLDGTCGTDSAVQISIPASADYGKLQFNSGMPGYPAGLTLGGLTGASADVSFSTSGSDQPYFLLAFTDSSDSLGQGSAGDQILMIEFQSGALSGSTLALDPNTTLFNLYDNTAGQYLQAGQSDTKTTAGWLADFPALDSEALQGIWVGEGLAGGPGPSETLTVNSLSVTSSEPVPEPTSITLLGMALVGFGLSRRRRAG